MSHPDDLTHRMKKITRRKFLSATAAAAAGAIGCDTKNPTDPGFDPDQNSEFVKAIITGRMRFRFRLLGVPPPQRMTVRSLPAEACTEAGRS